LDSSGDGCEWYEELGCVDADFMLVFAALVRMQLAASVVEAFSLEKTNRPVRDVV
jgi:hypothetical protein